MITKEELEHTYSNLSNNELLEILDRKVEHTEFAILIAIEELSKRNISEEDVLMYKSEMVEKASIIQKQLIIDDLFLLQKIFFYFIWVPIFTFTVKRNFVEDGCILKLKQAHYYSLLGFTSFVFVCIISAIYDPALSILFVIMLALFILAYFFDEFFNRKKQIERLQKYYREQEEANAITLLQDLD